jgi:hypothetical protein
VHFDVVYAHVIYVFKNVFEVLYPFRTASFYPIRLSRQVSVSSPSPHYNRQSDTAQSPSPAPANASTSPNYHHHASSGGTDALRAGGGHARFDKGDERAMGAFCAEVACALKRRSVEAAFMKVRYCSWGASGASLVDVVVHYVS